MHRFITPYLLIPPLPFRLIWYNVYSMVLEITVIIAIRSKESMHEKTTNGTTITQDENAKIVCTTNSS